MTTYWRELDEYERKVDFAAMEFTDEAAIREHRVNIGMIATDMQEQYVAWVSDRSFGVESLRKVPWFNFELLADEFTRLESRSHFDGRLAYAQMKARQSEIEGKPVAAKAVIPTEKEQKAMRLLGHDDAREFTSIIIGTMAPALDSAFSPMGRRLKSTEVLVAEIRGVFAAILKQGVALASPANPPKPKQKPPVRRMKIRDRAAYEKWQARYVPFSKRMSKLNTTGVLSDKWTKDWIQTTRTARFNAAIMQEAVVDPDCVQILYSGIRDDKQCEVCADRDGIVRPKGDAFWESNTPPMHDVCRCGAVPIFRSEKQRVTPKGELPDTDNVQPGFGGFDKRILKLAEAA